MSLIYKVVDEFAPLFLNAQTLADVADHIAGLTYPTQNSSNTFTDYEKDCLHNAIYMMIKDATDQHDPRCPFDPNRHYDITYFLCLWLSNVEAHAALDTETQRKRKRILLPTLLEHITLQNKIESICETNTRGEYSIISDAVISLNSESGLDRRMAQNLLPAMSLETLKRCDEISELRISRTNPSAVRATSVWTAAVERHRLNFASAIVHILLRAGFVDSVCK